MDLAVGPLARVELIKLADDEHAVLVGLHHIIYDGWSIAVLRQELLMAYRSYAEGLPLPLPELPIQYVDYAVWQRDRLSGEAFENLRGYWLNQLQDVPQLELPTDHPRPKVRTTRGASRRFQLSDELSRALKDLGQREQATLFMTLLAAFQVLLLRYSGQDSFAVGAPVAGRLQPGTENLIGFFANTLALRADLSGDPSFRELLHRVRETALAAYDHQEMPFGLLVQELCPRRDPGSHPVFQVMCVLQNFPLDQQDLSELELSGLAGVIRQGAADFDLSLGAHETEQGIRLSLSYRTELFDETTIERMTEHFQVLIESAADDPDRPISQLPLMTKAERKQVLVDWNNTDTDLPRSKCVPQLFEAQAEKTPDALALIDGPTQLTYQELNERVNQLAWHLQARGVGPDQPVAVRLDRSAELIVAMLAVLKAGGAYLPLDVQLPAERLQFMLENAAVDVVVTRLDLRSGLAEGPRHIVCVDANREQIASGPAVNPPCPVTSDNLAYVIYTSGSTGRPKGVMIEHRTLTPFALASAAEYEITPSDRVLQFASASFDTHVIEIFPCLVSGATLVLRTDEMLDCRRFLQRCDQWQVTAMLPPTSFWHELTLAMQAEGLKLPESIRLIAIGGEAGLPERLAKWFDCVGTGPRLINGYGPTEATCSTCFAELTPADGKRQRLPIGRPRGDFKVYVLDTRRQPVPIGVPGELYIGGDRLARGYLNQPELTAKCFVADPFVGTPNARMYRTGDLVRWRMDGQLEFIGRTDQQVKIRGFRIELGEIERALSAHPSLAEAAVLACERAPGDLQLAAYVVGRNGTPPDTNQLRIFLGEQLPEYMVPAVFVVLDAMPLTSSDKLDRRALPKPDWGRSTSDAGYVAPRTDTERKLAELWCDVLSVERVGIDDSFFEMGGNSLLVLRLVSKIRERFSVEPSMLQLFGSPTIAGLAQVIDEMRQAGVK
jgi:amino acid adenylation domain-containing protein